ncbi:MAG: HAMP domain-containing protein [Lachnospiraceae bacterium]|nr:HAMP domain-containing protein [Lachnospiraceae bacterium]
MRKIIVKLILCFIVSIVAVFVIMNSFGVSLLKDDITEKLKNRIHAEAELLANEYVSNFFDSQVTRGQMSDHLKVIDRTLDARIWVINSKGAVLADTRAENGQGSINVEALDPGFLKGTFHENLMYKGVFDTPMMSATVPLMYDFSVRGYVTLLVPMDRVDEESLTYMNYINICILILVAVMLAIYVVIYIFTVVPIRRIRNAAMEYAKGNYEHKLKVRTRDEYEDLANTVQYMVDEIKNTDDKQKKFIANISHDFRSPLTSIKGYAEALKDGTIPREAEGKYLDVILFETERLTKLTSDLLELSSMDSRETRLDITTFDINQIIKRTVETFEGICTSKRVVLSLEFSSPETYVEADMGKIQQVLYNLIDNAIKFSNQDSTVKISTEEKGDKALVSVKDNGVGIPKDSVKRIFDRFYKGDSSRGKDKKGTGLGLAIVKEIISVHEENITVISTEGAGTEFTFSIPLS